MTVEIHTPPNEQPVTGFYAVLSVDEHGEGICAMGTASGGMMPLVVAYPRLLPMLREAAAEIAKRTNRKVKLVSFSVREDMESFEP